MKKTAVVYKSKYGSTKKYAEMIANELGADLFDVSKVNKKILLEYDNIVYGGGLYASGINGIIFITNNYESLKNKNLIVFTVGLSSTDNKEIFKPIIEKNFSKEMQDHIHVFNLRGGMNYKKLTFIHRMMMSMMKSMIEKKQEKTKEDEQFLSTYGNKVDFIDKTTITALVSYVNKLA